jgi:hypothetical protein
MDIRTNAAVPRPASAGPEMDALGRFYQEVCPAGIPSTANTGR